MQMQSMQCKVIQMVSTVHFSIRVGGPLCGQSKGAYIGIWSENVAAGKWDGVDQHCAVGPDSGFVVDRACEIVAAP